jgi:hypothetical protein
MDGETVSRVDPWHERAVLVFRNLRAAVQPTVPRRIEQRRQWFRFTGTNSESAGIAKGYRRSCAVVSGRERRCRPPGAAIRVESGFHE